MTIANRAVYRFAPERENAVFSIVCGAEERGDGVLFAR